MPHLQAVIDEGKPDIIAVNAMSHEYEFFLSFWGDVIVPEQSLVIIGGIHATLKPEEVFRSRFFDLVCIGEGEWTFPRILDSVSNDWKGINSIENTFFRDKKKDGKEVRNPRRSLLSPDEVWSVQNDYSMYTEASHLSRDS